MPTIPGLVRRIAQRLADAADDLRPRTPPLPPAHLRRTYYRTPDPAAFAHACDVAVRELLDRGLKPHHRVLEIGCGIGNLALGLADFLTGSYDGLDVHATAVHWCQRSVTPRRPHFRFHHADVVSRPYNPRGRLAASRYCFPFPANCFDVVFLGSVFTHMLPDAVANYLAEIARVLNPGGFCVSSWFLLNDTTRPGVESGSTFLPFPVLHDSGLCRLHDAAVPEMAVALEEDFVLRGHEQVGLWLRPPIRRGRWWTGVSHDQDVITADKGRAPLGMVSPGPPG
jgi:SAM-dependent methyltransferase